MSIPSAELSTRRILIVDDEPLNLRVLDRMLRASGYTELRTTSDAREALPIFREFGPDLVLLDLHMPHLDGFAILELLEEEVPREEYLPVLVLTGDSASEIRERALTAGAQDFLTKPFDLTEVLLRIRNLLETRLLHLRLQEQNRTLEDRVRDRTRELADAQVEILHRLAVAAEYRDDVTGRHAERVGYVAALLGREAGMPEDDVVRLRRAATLHDVGKIGIPDSILLKKGPLTEEEFGVVRSHTEIGGRILSGSRFPLLRMAREIALSHHERWDGTGYSGGLAGEAIPLVGRLVAVADVFDSLTHSRPYKRAFPMKEALDIIVEGAGAHFDPWVVELFERLVAQGGLERLDERVDRALRRAAAVAANGGDAAEAGWKRPLDLPPLPDLPPADPDPRDPPLLDPRDAPPSSGGPG